MTLACETPKKRLRHRLARVVDARLPDACWVDLWAWSNGRGTLREAVSPTQFCVVEESSKACWCGKKTMNADDANPFPRFHLFRRSPR